MSSTKKVYTYKRREELSFLFFFFLLLFSLIIPASFRGLFSHGREEPSVRVLKWCTRVTLNVHKERTQNMSLRISAHKISQWLHILRNKLGKHYNYHYKHKPSLCLQHCKYSFLKYSLLYLKRKIGIPLISQL